MLQITADVFSGRPNPTWIVDDEQEARATLKELSRERGLMQEAAPTNGDLGLRGLFVDVISDDVAADIEVPSSLYLPLAGQAGRAQELAERLIAHLDGAKAAVAAVDGAPALEEGLRDFLTQQLRAPIASRLSVEDAPVTQEPAGIAAEGVATAALAVTCTIDLAAYNPGFWNNDATVRRTNNCYNYAANKRTNTFAQPGRGCGRIYTAITCPEVTRGALCDGLHRRYNCFPDSEKPRYLVALVVAPGPGFIDFHWYRKMKEGFWGHKPGSTAVRNVDNSGHVITNPETCNRGPYTRFCGYFYTCRSTRIR